MDVSPDKQNIDRIFANTTFLIDFYQRDYRWSTEQVSRLLDDVFFPFREQYQRLKDLEPSKEIISSEYPWYYLNTYVTNTVEGHVYVVDGQQRLTTLSLILIKLLHMGKHFESKLEKWIDSKIAGHAGFTSQFWMNHVGHTAIQKSLYDGELPSVGDKSGITAANLVANYRTISNWLDRELKDKRTFETFVFYFLHRLVLIELAVEQTDVPMLFESINDRGMRLRPHEILKGKLLGQISKLELEKDSYNDLWEGRASAINAYNEDQLDEFFRFYLKAKFADTRREGQRFDGDYHREMFSQDMDSKLGLRHAHGKVKTFLKGDFSYFSDLYEKLLSAYRKPQPKLQHHYYSGILNIDAPFLLTLSACRMDDPDEEVKMQTIGFEIERYFSLLQLQDAYNSNNFQDSLYRISKAIRERPVNTFRGVFDKELRTSIAASRNVDDVEPLSYTSFRQTGIGVNANFKRYFFARIDQFLAEQIKVNPKHSIWDLVNKKGPKTGFHVEHILSWNQANLSLFGDDEERFERERNRLGGILLLKGKDNISSGNEPYGEKLKSYANTLYWNETLREDTYKSALDLKGFIQEYDLDLKPLECFGPKELESRQQLLFDIVSIIWQ